MSSSRRSAVVLVVLAALVWTAPASAGHGADDDALDMTHLANSPRTGVTNTDIAFWGDQAYSGYSSAPGGFRILDISNPSQPQVLVDYGCAGSQNDVGVWDTGTRRLLFLSVDGQRANADCVRPAPNPPVSPQQPHSGPFEGIRIFDVTDPANPVYLKAVFTDCGSHTQTVVPVRRTTPGEYVLDAVTPDRVFIYVSSYVLTGVSATRCPDTQSGPGQVVDPTHNKISIVEVPFDAPEQAGVLKEVALHPQTLPFEPDPLSRGCHDIGVFVALELAVAACQGEGQVWDISDPANPDTMRAQRIFNESINYWHSASFSWDGRYLIFGDEEGGAAITHGCINADEKQPAGTGATWFYDRESLRSNPFSGAATGRFIQTREQFSSAETICTSHNYNVVPVTDRYLLVLAYYEGGSSVLDFTDVTNIEEIAYFDAAGGDTNPDGHVNSAGADTWSSYWYNGNVFGNDIGRGVDIFGLTGRPASFVAGAQRFGHLNPQTQELILAGPPCAGVLLGTKKADRLRGTADSERISGGRGDDRIRAGGGGDCLRGGAGADRIHAGDGNDDIRGGRGKDRLRGGADDDVIRAVRGARDRVNCGPGDDTAFINRAKDTARQCENVVGQNANGGS